MKRTKLKDRVLPVYTKGEEIFNMTSHIFGAVLGIVATILCVIMSALHNNVYGIVSSSIYRSLHNILAYCRFLYTICFV